MEPCGMAPQLSKDQLLTMYRKMYLIRRFEERAAQSYQQGKINGFCHLYIGQEAVAVGTTEALRPDDYQLGAYRDHAYPLTRGADPGMVMAELFGRATGYCKGKGGSMHIFDVEHFVLGGYGIVGGQIPLAAGLAFASKYRNDGRVTVCYFGEAAANQGAFHETLNMASKWSLPVIFLCENNRYGMGTAFARVSPLPEVYKRAAAYGIRGEPVDGMDVLKVYEAVKDCAAYARAGKGPVLLEANTYRYRGHSMSDAATYRTKAEVETERKGDPIPKLRQHCVEQAKIPASEFEKIDAEVKAQVDAAVKFADESPEPSLDELHEDVMVEPGEPDVKPRERVLGIKVDWPVWPGPKDYKVTWDLEPREQAEEADEKAGLKPAKQPARA
jgi:pyruvate dehydrogenase E1 component subunit alpha